MAGRNKKYQLPMVQSQEEKSLQNCILVWLDANIDKNIEYYRTSLDKFREIVFTVLPITTIQDLKKIIANMRLEKILLVVSGIIDEVIIPQIHNMLQVYAIFILSPDKKRYQTWPQSWSKVQLVSTAVKHICESLRKTIQQCDHDAMPMSLIPNSKTTDDDNFQHLELSFMHAMLFKDILLDIVEDEDKSVQELVSYCLKEGISSRQLREFQNHYRDKSAVGWYVSDTLLCSILNKSLRNLDLKIMIKMGFFIRSLHKQLLSLHGKQAPSFKETFIVYHGQGLSTEDFQYLQNTKGGLLRFNSFLSTHTDRKMGERRIEQNLLRYQQNVGVIFVMEIDPRKINPLKTPFARINEYKALSTEDEILFSIYTVFRIVDIKQSTDKKHYWEVALTITDGEKPQWNQLAQHIKMQTPNPNPWYQMSQLVFNTRNFPLAEELYSQLMDRAANDSEKIYLCQMLGDAKMYQGKYREAVKIFEKSIYIQLKKHRADDTSLLRSYNSIAFAYNSMSNYRKTLRYLRKVIKIQKNISPKTDPNRATVYIDVGTVYGSMGEYPKAMKYLMKANIIFEEALPMDHPVLTISYWNIADVYKTMTQYSKALEYCEKNLKIFQKNLPSTYPFLSAAYNKIGEIYFCMKNYPKAIEYCHKEREIIKKIQPLNYVHLASCYKNIGDVYVSTKNYSKALDNYKKSLKIAKDNLPPTHPYLAISYDNFGLLYYAMKNFSKAIKYFSKECKIIKKNKPLNGIHLGGCYNNMSQVYREMGDYIKAISLLDRAYITLQESLPPKHPIIQQVLANIDMLRKKI